MEITPEALQSRFQQIKSKVAAAELEPIADRWIQAFSEWNDIKAEFQGETARVRYALSKNLADQQIEERDTYFREKVSPIYETECFDLNQLFLKSKHREAIAEHFGKELLATLKVQEMPLAPINAELRVKDGDAAHRYTKWVGQGMVKVQGKEMPLSFAQSLQKSSDLTIRKEAFMAYRQWFLDHRTELASIYSEMVQLRHQMSRNLGLSNFIELGHAAMGRTDYGANEIAQFRMAVRKYIVPLERKINERKARAHGGDRLKAWDMSYDPTRTLPRGIAPVSSQLDRASRVFARVVPQLAHHFEQMRKEGLIDLEARPNKQAGAFCTSFADTKKVAILCNSTGDAEDVSTLMHEMGHAFQGSESQRIESVDLRWPTYDACEIHSMGLEYLSQRAIGEFFDEENARKYCMNRYEDAISLISYVCVVDEFQHWVYANPDASESDRDEKWSELFDQYKPGIDFTGIEPMKYARWYAQGHLFRAPFYYIDYAIAETGALQLALIDSKDQALAQKKYIELCRLGGTLSVLKLFKKVDMRSPFDETLIADLARMIESRIGL